MGFFLLTFCNDARVHGGFVAVQSYVSTRPSKMMLHRALALALLLAPVSPAALPLRAADMSALAVEDCALSCNRFRAAADAPPSDALKILSAAGFNTVRLRVWVSPTPDHPEGNASYVVALAARARNASLGVWLDFHLSDWWADPGHQTKPASWVALSAPDLEAAVHSHVTEVTRAVAAVSDVVLVQVGNEISPGALWPAVGQACADSGSVTGSCTTNWPEFGRLIGAGISAARAAAPTATIAIHTDLGNRGANAAADVIEFYTHFDAALPPGVEYDAIALSYYMEWKAAGPGAERGLAAALALRFPDKRLIMAETSAVWAGTVGTGPYAPTPAGQLQFWRDTIGNATAGGWAGVSWWGGEYAGAWTALFDGDYVALPALLSGWA